jgi:hypothetical protein
MLDTVAVVLIWLNMKYIQDDCGLETMLSAKADLLCSQTGDSYRNTSTVCVLPLRQPDSVDGYCGLQVYK